MSRETNLLDKGYNTTATYNANVRKMTKQRKRAQEPDDTTPRKNDEPKQKSEPRDE